MALKKKYINISIWVIAISLILLFGFCAFTSNMHIDLKNTLKPIPPFMPKFFV